MSVSVDIFIKSAKSALRGGVNLWSRRQLIECQNTSVILGLLRISDLLDDLELNNNWCWSVQINRIIITKSLKSVISWNSLRMTFFQVRSTLNSRAQFLEILTIWKTIPVEKLFLCFWHYFLFCFCSEFLLSVIHNILLRIMRSTPPTFQKTLKVIYVLYWFIFLICSGGDSISLIWSRIQIKEILNNPLR